MWRLMPALPCDEEIVGSMLRFEALLAHKWGLRHSEAVALYWLCAGYTGNKALAARCGIGVDTTKKLLERVMRRIGCQRLRHAVVLAVWPLYRQARGERQHDVTWRVHHLTRPLAGLPTPGPARDASIRRENPTARR